jgi:hypothetical protein
MILFLPYYSMKIPIRYLPKKITKKDRKKQIAMLQKSKTLYKKGTYYTREKLKSYVSRPSSHVAKAIKLYRVDSMAPSKKLASATNCSLHALNTIVKKGQGAYFSSGSRPNQTAHSWGLARLASSLTGGKSAAVDFSIIEDGCSHHSTAYKLALQSRKKHGHGKRGTPKFTVRNHKNQKIE